MIQISRSKYGIPYRIEWFSPAPRATLFPPTIFYQSTSATAIPGLVRRPFNTYLSSLDGTPEDWLARMNSTTRNEVKQGAKLDFRGDRVEPTEFLAFFNAFAREKGIRETSEAKLASLGTHLWTTEVRQGDRVLAMHALVVDLELGRARLLLSANARFGDPSERSLIGKANRWLHWWDMQECQKAGLRDYDWGGYAKDTVDEAKLGINRFKEAFGGRPVEETHYYPFFLAGLVD